MGYILHPGIMPRSKPGKTLEESTMKWTTPTAKDVRYGFEITMYFAHR